MILAQERFSCIPVYEVVNKMTITSTDCRFEGDILSGLDHQILLLHAAGQDDAPHSLHAGTGGCLAHSLHAGAGGCPAQPSCRGRGMTRTAFMQGQGYAPHSHHTGAAASWRAAGR